MLTDKERFEEVRNVGGGSDYELQMVDYRCRACGSLVYYKSIGGVTSGGSSAEGGNPECDNCKEFVAADA